MLWACKSQLARSRRCSSCSLRRCCCCSDLIRVMSDTDKLGLPSTLRLRLQQLSLACLQLHQVIESEFPFCFIPYCCTSLTHAHHSMHSGSDQHLRSKSTYSRGTASRTGSVIDRRSLSEVKGALSVLRRCEMNVGQGGNKRPS